MHDITDWYDRYESARTMGIVKTLQLIILQNLTIIIVDDTYTRILHYAACIHFEFDIKIRLDVFNRSELL